MNETKSGLTLIAITLTAILSLALIASAMALSNMESPPELASALKNYSDLETRLFKQARRSTFQVLAASTTGEHKWSGTGFLAKIEGKLIIVTAGHVCDGETVYTLSQSDDLFTADVLAVSGSSDVCFMSVNSRIRGMQPYVIKTRPLPYGKYLVAIGHAFGGRLTQYLIKAIGEENVEVEGIVRQFHTASGTVYPGQSGGPVVDNVDGTAVALVSATDRVSRAYITDGKTIIADYKRLVAGKKEGY